MMQPHGVQSFARWEDADHKTAGLPVTVSERAPPPF
jgi:hypothetical protein